MRHTIWVVSRPAVSLKEGWPASTACCLTVEGRRAVAVEGPDSAHGFDQGGTESLSDIYPLSTIGSRFGDADDRVDEAWDSDRFCGVATNKRRSALRHPLCCGIKGRTAFRTVGVLAVDR